MDVSSTIIWVVLAWMVWRVHRLTKWTAYKEMPAECGHENAPAYECGFDPTIIDLFLYQLRLRKEK